MEGLRNKLKAVNRMVSGGPMIFSILDRDANKGNVVAAGHVLSAVGCDIAFDPSRNDEGVWLERRSKKQSLVRVSKARLLKMENGHLEFVFDDPIPRGTYLIAIYTRSGKGTEYKTIRICRQVKAL